MDSRRTSVRPRLRHRGEELPNTTPNSNNRNPSSPSRTFPTKRSNATASDRKKASYARLSRVMQTSTFDDYDDDDDDNRAPPSFHPVRRPHSTAADPSQRQKRYPAVKTSDQKAVESSLQIETSSTEQSPSPVKNDPLESFSFESSKSEKPVQVETPAVIQASEALELPVDRSGDNGLPRASKVVGSRAPLNNYEASRLQDELDMLQLENESINEKLQLAEERSEAAEARATQLEKQIASFGDNAFLEEKSLGRKEAELREREEAMKAAEEDKDENDELIALRRELRAAKNEANAAMEELHEAESVSKTLNSITRRMILSQEEQEELVLKRCWLARYWGLAVRFGVYLDIAPSKHEYWSLLAPLSGEVVIAAAQKAKEPTQGEGDHEKNKPMPDLNDITTENTIESVLVVEKGLLELASLKVEDAVILTMANCRFSNLVQESISDLSPTEEPEFEVELSTEESDDVLFKQAWLAYYWARARNHGVEEDIAEERLQFWSRERASSLTAHDAVDVERGITELRKLGIEEQLWEAYRKEIDESQLSSNRRDFESQLSE